MTRPALNRLNEPRCQSSLAQASGDVQRSPLSAFEPSAGRGIEHIQVGGAQVGHRVSLEPDPSVFHRTQLWRLRRQERHLDIDSRAIQVLAHQLASMRPDALNLCGVIMPIGDLRLIAGYRSTKYNVSNVVMVPNVRRRRLVPSPIRSRAFL